MTTSLTSFVAFAAVAPAAAGADSWLSNLAVPGIVIAIVVAMAFLGIIIASRYKAIPPNSIGVFYGRKYRYLDENGKPQMRGFRAVTGGGTLVWPIVEQYQVMSTAAFQVEIKEQGVPTRRNVPVNFEGVATCRISPNPHEQANAVQAFLGKDQESIAETIQQILRGHMRTIVGGLDVEQILRDRAEFNKRVLSESAEEFQRLGVQIVTLVVQDVKDAHGYIEALGKQEIAAKIRDAAIQTAEAEKETKIKVSNALRESAEVEAQNAVKVALAQKEKSVQEANFKVETESRRAAAETAFSISKAEQEKQLRVIEAERDARAAEAGIAVQEKMAALKERELQATLLTEAEAQRKAAIIKAEAEVEVARRNATRLEQEAEGKRAATVKDGDGQAVRTLRIAEAEAAAVVKRTTAEAEGKRAGLLAEAEGQKAHLMAVADGKQAALLAEATGTEKLAEALAKLSESGKLIMILDRLPSLLEKGGDAGAKVLAAVFEPLGESMGAIKQVSIVDMGGSGAGKSGVERFAGSIPGLVADVVAKAQAQGVDLTSLLKLLKIDPSRLQDMLGSIPVNASPAASAAPSEKQSQQPDAVPTRDA